MNKLQEHESEYFHIRKPSKERLKQFFIGIGLLLLCALSIKLLVNQWNILNISSLFSPDNTVCNFNQLNILLNISLTFFSFLFGILLTFNLIDKFDFNSLIGCLITGLIAGLIAGLIPGLIAGLITGFIVSLVFSLIAGIL